MTSQSQVPFLAAQSRARRPDYSLPAERRNPQVVILCAPSSRNRLPIRSFCSRPGTMAFSRPSCDFRKKTPQNDVAGAPGARCRGALAFHRTLQGYFVNPPGIALSGFVARASFCRHYGYLRHGNADHPNASNNCCPHPYVMLLETNEDSLDEIFIPPAQ